MINYTYAFQKEFKLTSSKDVVLQQFTPSFDAFVEEFYPALLNGIKIFSISKHTILNSNRLKELINSCIIINAKYCFSSIYINVEVNDGVRALND